MDNLKTRAFEAFHKARQYLLSTIVVSIVFACLGFVLRWQQAGRTMAMSELLSWIEWVLIPALIGLAAVFLWHFFRVGLKLKAILRFSRLILKVITRLKKSGELLTLIDEQKKNPAKYLYPVVEIIDLNRQGSAHDDNNVYIRFQIDSHLLFPVTEFYVFAKLYLAPDNVRSTESDWYEIEKPERYTPIGILERYRFGESLMHLIGETFEEKTLLEWMQDFRKGKPLLAMLKIGIKFKKDDSPIRDFILELQGGGPRYIAPINDYRMA